MQYFHFQGIKSNDIVAPQLVERSSTRRDSMARIEVAYLGPIGTYSHLVAEKRFGHRAKLVPLPTILDVCTFVSQDPLRRHGIVPIENSSGGAIYEMVDILLGNSPRVRILEELSLDVRLALLGRRGEKCRILYSHFAPLEHCVSWLKRNLPRAEKRVVATTAIAAQQASCQRNAMALGNRRLAQIYGLEVLHYPVQADVPNITVFLLLGGTQQIQPKSVKSTLAVKLPNRPGSLCTFLEAFRDQQVNLSRLLSRPLRGCPRQYAFLVDIEGHPDRPNVRKALALARKASVQLRSVGSFPCRHPYKS
jgi:prephenate dehydratase